MCMTDWYYEDGDRKQNGPHEAEEILKRLNRGDISRERLVWRSGMSEWQPLSRTELAEHLKETPPPLPVRGRVSGAVESEPEDTFFNSPPEDVHPRKGRDWSAPRRGFVEAVLEGIEKTLTYSGRASRSEYWYYILFMILANVLIGFFGFADAGAPPNTMVSLIYFILIIPGFAVTARRLHDIGKSGWWQLSFIIPILGTILMLVWTCTRGQREKNRFDVN